MKGSRTIALINHQPILLEGLVRIFAVKDSIVLLEFGLPSNETVDLIIRRNPDLILFDSDEQDRGVAKIARIARDIPDTKVVVFASGANVEHAVRAFEAGAAGYISSASTSDELLHAVKAVLAGETFISQSIATKVITALRTAAIREAATRSKALSVREEQIANLLLKGKTNKEIARGLGLSEKTVKHYLTILMQKLETRNRTELALAIGPQRAAANRSLFN